MVRGAIVSLLLLPLCVACGDGAAVTTIRDFDITLPGELVSAAERAGVDLTGVLDDALARVEETLDPEPTAIVFQVGDQVIPQAGTVGFTDPSTGRVQITVDTDPAPGLEQTLTHWVPHQLAHELHHSKRITQGPGYGMSLGEALVAEGLADAYASDLYPDVDAPWTKAIGADVVSRAWSEAKEKLDGPYSFDDHARWFFGSGDHPNWTGYTMGYRIARAYLAKHADVTAAGAFDAATADVLREGAPAG